MARANKFAWRVVGGRADVSRPRPAPQVSVIVPTYRHADFIGATLESVFAQTFTDYEVIVINDASPDDTDARLRPLAEAGRIRYVRLEKNGGQAAARNQGIALARGAFIALLDDDDLWPPDKLDWQVAALEAHPEAVVVYGRPSGINESGAPFLPRDRNGDPEPYPWNGGPGGDVYEAFAQTCWMVSPGQALIRRTTLDTLMGDGGGAPLDATLWGCDDWDLWLRLAERGRFVFEDHVALHYRFHATNASRDAFRLQRGYLALYRKHRRRNRRRPDRLAILRAAENALRADLPGWWLAQAYADWRVARHPAGAARKIAAVLALGPRPLLSRRFFGFLRGALGRARRLYSSEKPLSP